MCLQGQFTRFQRVFHMMPYRLLLHHEESSLLSSLQAGNLSIIFVLLHLKALAVLSSHAVFIKQTLPCFVLHKVHTLQSLIICMRAETCCTCRTWQVSEFEWRQRLLVQGINGEAVFEFTMLQRFGGQYDGIFYTRYLKADPPWRPKLPAVHRFSNS
jgi:hypothetical protein